MNELALFAGAGGGLLGSRLLGWRTVCYVEWDAYCIDVLKARIRDGYLDDAPIWDDASTFDGVPWAGSVDIITAGFPCQPFSNAGVGLEERDPRNQWPATLRIIREVRPPYLLLENVAALLSKRYVDRVFGGLAESGYRVRWDCIPASAIGAPHERDRLWIAANSNGIGRASAAVPERESEFERSSRTICNTPGQRLPNRECGEMAGSPQRDQILQSQRPDWWKTEPGLGRVADGVAHRVDRLRALGNGQVPGVVRAAWDLLHGGEEI